jgi:hypothetical protein
LKWVVFGFMEEAPRALSSVVHHHTGFGPEGPGEEKLRRNNGGAPHSLRCDRRHWRIGGSKRQIEKTKGIEGARFIHLFAPCSELSVEITREAVRSRLFAL